MADDIVKEAREAIETSFNYERKNRDEAVIDLQFVAGHQWSEEAKQQRRGRPLITINRSQQFLRQVSNPIRQNMPIIKVEPEADENEDAAELINGIMRRILYNSSASHVFASATEHCVACGIGWFRVTTDYVKADSFDQEILIRRIFNPLSVFPDPGSMEPDRSDMQYCAVSEPIPLAAFKKKYPKASTQGMDRPTNSAGFNGVGWQTSDWVRVAEYWKRKPFKKTIAALADGSVVELADPKSAATKALMSSGLIVNTREVTDYRVVMTLVSGAEQLEDEYEFPCSYIPLIPVIGAEIPLDEGSYRHGLIRFQREPQQLTNYMYSVAVETLGQQPKTPWLVTQKMVGKFKALWDNANRDSTPYLPYEPDPSAPGGKPERSQPPAMPTALVQMAQLFSEEMKGTTGIYDAALGARSNETSGRAIAAREEQGNQASFHFVDNLEHSLEHLGRILVKMIPKVYDTPRQMKIMGEDDSEKTVPINQPVMAYDGEPVKINDLSQVNYSSVRVVLGPNYASRRQQAVQEIIQLIQAVPAVAAVAGDIVVKNMDFDGSEELAERLKKVLPPELKDDNDQEQMQQPDPMAEMQAQMAQQAMQLELASAEAKASQEASKAQQESSKAEQEAARVEGEKLDNAFKYQRLVTPTGPNPTDRNNGNGPF